MQIAFSCEGGVAVFPGLSRPVIIRSEDLTEAEASDIQRLLSSADVTAMSTGPSTGEHRGADRLTYTIVIEDAGKRQVIRASDPLGDGGVRDLVALLRKKAAEVRRKAVHP